MFIAAGHLTEEAAPGEEPMEQLDLFSDFGEAALEKEREEKRLEREKRRQEAMLKIKNKYGKNAILYGTSFEEGATGRERNQQIGGHRA
jgi:DNA polymerase V